MNDIEKEKLYSEYKPKVFGYILNKIGNSDEAEDICADVFVKIYSHIDSFDESLSSISTWIYNITRNTLYDHYRTTHINAEEDENIAEEGSIEDTICNEETLEELAKALKTLDDKERDIILFHYYRDKTLKEISDIMHLSYSYVKLLHNNALVKLEKLLKND